jgi:hypothetical protein
LIRSEYVALARELPFLRDGFALPSPTALRDGVCATLEAFECLDRHYDRMPHADRRRAFADDIVRSLAGAQAPLPDEVTRHLAALRQLFASHVPAIANRLARFTAMTETARTTRAPREYIAAIEEEGRLTSEMVLLLFANDPPSRFPAFFVQLGIVGNLVDKLCDVRDDFAAGEIVLEPNVALHLRLLGAFVKHAAIVVAMFPRRAALVVWGAKYFKGLL